MKTFCLELALGLVRVGVNSIYLFISLAILLWVLDYPETSRLASANLLEGYELIILAYIFADILSFIESKLRDKYL
ncbi:hypothetical protein ACN9JF_19210 (plasmid) [Pseudoalteromonas lipolytica]|uniref:hypothetical protein n=1 Tax=Pseudoalteromonas lipolytica TaxID=570156 RepID=UPI003BA10DD8